MKDKDNNESDKSSKKLKIVKKVLFFSILVLLCILVGGGIYIYSSINNIKKVQIPNTNSDLDISNDAALHDSDIINIAFMGLDSRTKDEVSRSDSLMILTIDKKHKNIKISSVMRDTYVNVQGHGMQKITHAHAFGGAPLTIKTLNQNFDLNIRDYVSVDFFGLEKIIDALGGVEIEVKQDEVKYIADYMKETSGIENKSIIPVTHAGLQTLNGMQAVAYARIRYTAGGDFVRTDRQRTVLTALLNKIKKAGIGAFPSLVSKIQPYVETSLSTTDILSRGVNVFNSGTNNIEQERFPLDGYCFVKWVDGVWNLGIDLDKTKEQMDKFIFDDIKPVPGKPKF